MSEGIRIRPRAGLVWPDDGMIAVTDHALPFPDPNRDGARLVDVQPVCSICQTQHFAKTIHVQLRAGSAIVSTGVWDHLQGLADNPFEVVNVVVDPPAQGISPGSETRLLEKLVMPISSTN